MALSDTRKIGAETVDVSFLFVPLFVNFRGWFMSDYRALYRKWRPRDFDDVCGQDGITDILKYEVANSKLSHAYLFCGSRGTGKTSCAKILAKAVNCHNPKNGNPCNVCEACRSIDAATATDVIEMDAASNNGINDVRDMQDEIAFTPALLKYRVYIIDEVHMMSTSAFNALLKTLEEPPEYVIFILATTEFHKLPTTIVSRCQRFEFKRIANEVIMSRLLKMSEAEGIDITEDAARVIARVSRGGLRDAISLLELCAASQAKIDDKLVFSTVGNGNRESAYEIIDAILRADYSTVYGIVNDVVMRSADISVFWQDIIDSYRDIMVVKNTDKAKKYLDLTDVEFTALSKIASGFTMARLSYHVSILESAMADMQRAFNSKRSIAEIALTRMCDAKYSSSPESLSQRVEELERELAMIKLGVVPAQRNVQETEKTAEPSPESKAVTRPKSVVQRTEQLQPYSRWGAVIERIDSVKKSLSAGIANAVVYKYSDGSFLVRAKDFFAKKLSTDENDFTILRGVLAEIEQKSPSEIKINIQSQNEPQSSAISEIENALI